MRASFLVKVGVAQFPPPRKHPVVAPRDSQIDQRLATLQLSDHIDRLPRR